MNNKHAIINEQGLVVNMIIWEGAEWLPPRNHTVVHINEAYETQAGGHIGIGDSYDANTDTFTRIDRTAKDPEV